MAKADRLADLSATLASSEPEKARIAAVVSLGRLQDPRALKPLAKALRDKSNVVRAVSCVALGKLGDLRALPALQRATRDADTTVRKRAIEAVALIKDANKDAVNSRFKVQSRTVRAAHYRVDGHEAPLLPVKPELMLAVQTSADDSNGKRSGSARKSSADDLKRLMFQELKRDRRVTTSSQVARELKIPTYAIDLSITRMQRVVRGPWVEVECELRVAISNSRGRMLSFVTGGAKVQVAKKSFRSALEPKMQSEALENAVKSVHSELFCYLADNTGV